MLPYTEEVDLFPCCVDIHGIVSTHVETVVQMTRNGQTKQIGMR